MNIMSQNLRFCGIQDGPFYNRECNLPYTKKHGILARDYVNPLQERYKKRLMVV